MSKLRQLKRSQITDWWIAKNNLKMAFVNILSGEPLSEDLLVVGYFNKEEEVLATSTNRVVEVDVSGVITAKGTFYPWEEAHELYLQFLIEANKENTLIATKWEYVKKSDNMIIADIIRNGEIEEAVTFDFIPNKEYNLVFKGYSTKLDSNIVFTTFAKRNVCIIIGIPKAVKDDIYRSSFVLNKGETMKKVRLIQEMIIGK